MSLLKSRLILIYNFTSYTMDFFDQFPVMEQLELRDFKKGIDLAFRTFARTYGDAIESFFEPLLFFLVWVEKLF